MTVKMTGAEWKLFYSDEAAWPKDAYYQDEELTVDGAEWDWEIDIMSVSDDAVLRISGGVVILKEDDDNNPSLEAHFKRWRKRQNTAFLSCEAPKDRVADVVAAIIAAGGKVK